MGNEEFFKCDHCGKLTHKSNGHSILGTVNGCIKSLVICNKCKSKFFPNLPLPSCSIPLEK